MAFVYRNSKQRNDEGKNSSPGPGQYQSAVSEKANNPAVGFFNASAREIWKKSDTPGPGQYNSQDLGLKGSVDMMEQKIGITIDQNTQQPSCAFKSKSKRLFERQTTTPGPGQYYKQELQYQAACRKNVVSVKQTKLARYLIDESKKKTTDLNIRQNFSHSRIVQQPTMKSRQMSQAQKNKKSRTSSFASTVKRNKITRPQTTKVVGPGSYQIASAFNFLDRKPIHIEKDSRIQNLPIKKQSKSQVQDQQEKKGISNLGPGSYNTKNQGFVRNSPSYSKGIACFGSKQSRFGKKINAYNRAMTPGPQSYTISQQKSYQSACIPKKKVPFNCGSHKNLQYSTPAAVGYLCNISPGSYNPKNDFSDLLKKNYMKGSVGNFGSTVQRFVKPDYKKQKRQQHFIDTKGLQICHPSGKEEKKVQQKYCPQKIRNTLQKRIVIRLSQGDQRPLCYDNQHQTIGKKFQQKIQKNVPFMTGTGRFQVQASNLQLQILQCIKNDEQNKLRIYTGASKKQKFPRKVCKTISPMAQFKKLANNNNNIKRPRKEEGRKFYQNKQNYNLGPQTYNPNKMEKGRSYNVLFKKP